MKGVEKRREGGYCMIRGEGEPRGGAMRGDRPACKSTLEQDDRGKTVQ